MKIFVFGAGASMDAQHIENLSPAVKAPLMRELFAERYYTFAQEVGLPHDKFVELRTTTGDNVEQYLTQRWAEKLEHQSRRFREAEQNLFGQLVFYMWRLLLAVSITYNNDEQNTYKVFLRKIISKDEDFGFINFNYDTLLDKAIKDAYGTHFSSLEDYFAIDYIKPHGSVNWLMSHRATETDIEFPGEFYLEPRYSMASNKMFAGEAIPYQNIKVLDPKDPNLEQLNFRAIIQSIFGWRFFYPLVFIPLTTKLYDSVAEFNATIVAKGKEMMRQATEVYLIGYSASDQIIRDMLRYVPYGTKLHVIGRQSSQKILETLLEEFNMPSRQSDAYTEGFTKFVSEL
jgi:hypothetical protein